MISGGTEIRFLKKIKRIKRIEVRQDSLREVLSRPRFLLCRPVPGTSAHTSKINNLHIRLSARKCTESGYIGQTSHAEMTAGVTQQFT
jgi:hypothetical protein